MNMTSTVAQKQSGAGHARYGILAILFFATAVNYADRATLSIAGSAISKDLRLDPVAMGYVFSAFGWAYVVGQIPGGWLHDRFGPKRVYACSLILCSSFAFLQGAVGIMGASAAVVVLFALRFLAGLAGSPAFPGNARIVAAWFPAAERGTASAVFNSGQYFATVLFVPIMGILTHALSWKYVFIFIGLVEICTALVWIKVMYNPWEHPSVTPQELDYIQRGGALVSMDAGGNSSSASRAQTWRYIRELLSSRMLLGIYLGQYCITTLTYFFLTWFPVYLVEARGMSILRVGFVATLPALCGFVGGLLGGGLSDYLLKRRYSLTTARKTPIVLGMLLSVSMIGCNYVAAQWAVVVLLALSFFGKGIGALGWTVVSDTSPKQIAGLSGGLFNTFGNLATITTPIAIGYIVKESGSFDGALVFVAANAVLAIVSYLMVVGEIKRVELKSS